jgi:hypothetical protein
MGQTYQEKDDAQDHKCHFPHPETLLALNACVLGRRDRLSFFKSAAHQPSHWPTSYIPPPGRAGRAR